MAAPPIPGAFSPFMSPIPTGGFKFGVDWDSDCRISFCSGDMWTGDVDLVECLLPASPPRVEVRGDTRPVWTLWC